MAFTESNMLPLGTKAPAFSLPDTVSGQVLSLNELPVTGEDLRTILDTLLRGDKVSEKQFPSASCNIK